jgi:hypothetical protein
MNDQENDKGGADTNRKADDIDKGKNLVPPEMADRDEQVVFEHGSNFSHCRDTTFHPNFNRVEPISGTAFSKTPVRAGYRLG